MALKHTLFNMLFFRFRARNGALAPVQPLKILIIRQDNRIGNLVFITPFLRLCAERFPGSRRDVVAGGFFSTLLQNNPDIHAVKVYDQLAFIRNPARFVLFMLHLRAERYDLVFDLKPVFSFNNMMMTVLSATRFRVGFKNPVSHAYFNVSVDHPSARTYEAAYLCALLGPFMAVKVIPQLRYLPRESDVSRAARVIADLGLHNAPLVLFHTGGRGQKKIDPRLFAAVARTCVSHGFGTLFFTGPDEKEDKLIIEKEGFACVQPADVNEFGGYLRHGVVFVSGDTGPLHMAAGADIATVSLWIASSSERYAPQGQNHRALSGAQSADQIAVAVLEAARSEKGSGEQAGGKEGKDAFQ